MRVRKSCKNIREKEPRGSRETIAPKTARLPKKNKKERSEMTWDGLKYIRPNSHASKLGVVQKAEERPKGRRD